MLCLLVTACSYDWGGSVLIIEEKATEAHLGEENVGNDMDQDDVQEKLCRRLLRACDATWGDAPFGKHLPNWVAFQYECLQMCSA